MHRFIFILFIWFLFFNGGSRYFDGTNDSVDFGDIPALSDATDITCMCWVYTTNVTSDQTILSNWASDGIIFFQDDSGNGRTDTFSIAVGESGASFVMGSMATNSAVVNTWQHVAFSINCGSATGMRFYLNGVEDANSPVNVSTIDDVGNVNEGWHVGAGPSDEDDRAGNQAYCQCWNIILGLDDLNEALTCPGSILKNFQLYAPLLGDSTEPDWSGNGHTGTVTGSVASSDGPPIMFCGDVL